jgi:peptidoglycan/LPS O-acetylase OafA/YrhL
LVAVESGLALYAQACWTFPVVRVTHSFYWDARDPFGQFHLGHFVLGMLVARHLDALVRWDTRSPALVRALAVCAVVPFLWITSQASWSGFQPVFHVPYMLGIVAMIASLTRGRETSSPVRFVSDSTFGIYLYHYMLHPMVMPWALTKPPVMRLAIVSTAFLGGSILFLAFVRGVLGPRWSRMLIGG